MVADLSEAAELRVCEYDALTGSYDASAGGRTFGLTRIALLAAVPGEVGRDYYSLLSTLSEHVSSTPYVSTAWLRRSTGEALV